MIAPVQISGSGLVTSVGLGTAETAAAIRAGLTNPQLTRFIDWGGEWIAAHIAPIEAPNSRAKLLRMVVAALEECLHARAPDREPALVLCLPEPSRPCTADALDVASIQEVAAALKTRFSSHSSAIAMGRVGGLIGLHKARILLQDGKVDAVLIAGVDSFVNWPTLNSFENQHRLLTSKNSNGFLAGEAAAAVMVTRTETGTALRCEGIGFADEYATVASNLPLRADGLVEAIRAAATDAQCAPQDFELRISGLSGEHYFFKEAALAATRLTRNPPSVSDLWHPADCVGEVGAAAGPLSIALIAAACAKGYSSASRILCHLSGDGTERAAAFFRYGVLP